MTNNDLFSPPPLSIKELSSIAVANDKKAGWDLQKPLDQLFVEFISLTHAELSEAIEDFRDNKGFTEVWYEEKEGGHQKPCGIPSELADVAIRVFGFAAHAGIDLQAAIEEKLKFNATRGHKHGGKKI